MAAAAGLEPIDAMFDLGCGIGAPARHLAATFGYSPLESIHLRISSWEASLSASGSTGEFRQILARLMNPLLIAGPRADSLGKRFAPSRTPKA